MSVDSTMHVHHGNTVVAKRKTAGGTFWFDITEYNAEGYEISEFTIFFNSADQEKYFGQQVAQEMGLVVISKEDFELLKPLQDARVEMERAAKRAEKANALEASSVHAPTDEDTQS